MNPPTSCVRTHRGGYRVTPRVCQNFPEIPPDGRFFAWAAAQVSPEVPPSGGNREGEEESLVASGDQAPDQLGNISRRPLGAWGGRSLAQIWPRVPFKGG